MIVVGYQNRDVDKDNTLGALTFSGIATSEIDIQDIKPYAPEGEELDNWMINIQTFDSFANASGQYGYFVRDDDEGLVWDGEGWYDFDTFEKADKKFALGEGFMLNSSYDDKAGAGYTISGAVAAGITKIPFNKDNSLMGNIRPTEIKIEDITPYAPEGEELDNWMINIQTFDSFANANAQYGYFVRDDDEGLVWDGAGWYDFDTFEKADKTFAAGEGFMLNSAYEDISSYEEGKSAYLEFKSVVE